MLLNIIAGVAFFAVAVAYIVLGVMLINWVRRNCKDTCYYDVLLPMLVFIMPMQAFMILFQLKTSWTYDQEKRNF